MKSTKNKDYRGFLNQMAPRPRFELGTKWLTATYSTAELSRNNLKITTLQYYTIKLIKCQS